MFGLFICVLISPRWKGYSPLCRGIWGNCAADCGHCGWIWFCLQKLVKLPCYIWWWLFFVIKRLFNITKEKEKKDVWWILFHISSNPFHFQKTVIRKTPTMLWCFEVLVPKVVSALLLQVCMFWETPTASRASQPALPEGDGAGGGCRLPRAQPVQKPRPAFPDTPLPGKDFASVRRDQHRCEIWMLLAVGKSPAAVESLGEAH